MSWLTPAALRRLRIGGFSLPRIATIAHLCLLAKPTVPNSK